MNKFIVLVLLITVIQGCDKDNDGQDDPCSPCDIQTVYEQNAAKVTITNGIWGTIAFREGNCMPVYDTINPPCKTCAIKRTVKIYEYTTRQQAKPSNGNSPVFFDSFTTTLIKEVETDENGFFQTDLPAGEYSIAVVEDGKLYANGGDGRGGISPFKHTGNTAKVNVTIDYKAAY